MRTIKKLIVVVTAVLLLGNAWGNVASSTCVPVGPGQDTSNCGTPPACGGACTRKNTSCLTCVGPSSGTCVTPGGSCTEWYEMCYCKKSGFIFVSCVCTDTAWTTVPGSTKMVTSTC